VRNSSLPILLACWALLPAAWVGCAYRTGLDLDHLGIRTLGVDVVANGTFRQRIEIPLTRRLQQDVEARMNLVPAPPDRADAVLRVTIRSAREHPLAEGYHDVVSVGSIVMVVRAELVDRRTGKVLLRGAAADWSEFILPVGENLESAVRAASEKISRRVVLLLDPEIDKLRNPAPSGEEGRSPRGGEPRRK